MLLLITFCVVFFIQFYFYFFLFRKYTSSQFSKNKPKNFSVSIVISAKNESVNLRSLFPVLSTQKYEKYEIILVDDASTDNTYDEMLSFQKGNLNSNFEVRIIQISPKDSRGKKAALSQGIKLAKNPYILLTDADCIPASDQWIQEMITWFSPKTTIVLGYGAYKKIKGSFLNKLIRFETLLTALQYFSFSISGKPYMGVGRNLAYKKEAFLQAGGFEKHSHIKSGDDDLFVSQMAKSGNTEICDNPNAFTVSNPHIHVKDWIKQKRRHITTANHYKPEIKFLLGLFYISQISVYALMLASIITKTYEFIIIPLFLVRLLFWYSIVNKTAKRLNEKDLIPFGPLYEISIIFIQLYIFLKNMISPAKHW